MRTLAMIPARMGSQRLAKKNLKEIRGAPLIAHAVRKCLKAGVFDEVWINSEHPDFGAVAAAEGAHFHRRPEHLGSNTATSEQFVAEFLEHHECDLVVQVHSIAPLLTTAEIASFVGAAATSGADVTLSVIQENLEHLYHGAPVNFTFSEKTNSQDLAPVERISWSITAWRRDTYLAAFRAGTCATYSGQVVSHPISRFAGYVVKTQEDFDVIAALWATVHGA